MAIDKNTKNANLSEPSPPRDRDASGFSLSHRASIGVNVGVMVTAALALLLLVNWAATTRVWKKDLSSLSRYSLSDSTRNVVEAIEEPVRITIVYDNEKDPEKARSVYHGDLIDLVTQIKQVGGENFTVEDVTTVEGRAELGVRMSTQHGGPVAQYRQVVADFRELSKTLPQELTAAQGRLINLVQRRTWAGNAPQVQRSAVALQVVYQVLPEVTKNISRAEAGPLTRYDRQVETIQQFTQMSVPLLQDVQRQLGYLQDLADRLKSDDKLLARTASLREQALTPLRQLQSRVSGKQTTQPDARLMADAAAAFGKVAAVLAEQGATLAALAEDQPALAAMPQWSMETPQGRQGLHEIFRQFAGEVGDIAEQTTLVGQKLTADASREFVESMAGQMLTQIDGLFAATRNALESLSRVDPASQAVLTDGAKLLDAQVASLRQMQQTIETLPELKAGQMVETLKEDNLVIVEVGDAEPRILTFDEVWPPVGGFSGAREARRETRRNFNGDSAIGSALLMASRPVSAEVVFVHFTPPQPPQMMMQQPPEEGPLPYRQFSVLRDRLEKSNLKVSEWNLASDLEPPPPATAKPADRASTQPEATTQPEPAALPRVYVVLPPGGPNQPLNAEQDEELGQAPAGFGRRHVEAFQAAMADGGRAIFLATWMPPQQPNFYMPPSEQFYNWNGYLAEQWGLTVNTQQRLIQGLLDEQPDKFGLSPELFYWMRLNNFNESTDIGKPLAARRVLLTDVAPIARADTTPDGVTLTTVLSVPEGNRTIWATAKVDELIEELTSQSIVSLNPGDAKPPIEVMVLARRAGEQGDRQPQKLVLFGGGRSLTDDFLQQQVVRMGEKNRLVFDNPPQVNSEIVVNSVYDLTGQEQMIAAGPVVMPTIKVPLSRLLLIQQMVIWGWPLLVLLVGGAIALYRRSR